MRVHHFIRMLLKRLLGNAAFWALLALIPALTLIYTLSAGADGAMVTVALAQEGNDPMARDVIDSLAGDSQLLRYTRWDSPADAVAQVELGKADCAWVFHADMSQALVAFVQTPDVQNAFVTVYQRESTPLLRIAREKLNAAFFPHIARQLYLAGLQPYAQALGEMTREEMLSFWENAQIPGELFRFHTCADRPQPDSFLLSPVRGLLALVVLLGAMGCGMYHIGDRQRGTFGYLPLPLQWLPLAVECGLCSLILALAGLTALCLGGFTGNFWKELADSALLAVGCTGFAMALTGLLGSVAALGAALPVVVLGSLVACPVFFPPEGLSWVGSLLPVYHYLVRPWALIPYSGVCIAIALTVSGFPLAKRPKRQ